jgi:hypothetical protein
MYELVFESTIAFMRMVWNMQIDFIWLSRKESLSV